MPYRVLRCLTCRACRNLVVAMAVGFILPSINTFGIFTAFTGTAVIAWLGYGCVVHTLGLGSPWLTFYLQQPCDRCIEIWRQNEGMGRPWVFDSRDELRRRQLSRDHDTQRSFTKNS